MKKGEFERKTGLYVHVPFCAKRCDFCAFYEEAPTVAGVERFLTGIEREAALVDGGVAGVGTVFWGGGTPGVLSARDLGRLGGVVRKFAGDGIREWTVEMTPTVVTEARLEVLRELGVTRISMGVQSFDEEVLKALGRRHTVEQVRRAWERLKAAGFESLNVDLMFALPGQSEERWLRDLEEVFAMGPDHVSTYCLTLEEDTALWLKMGGGKADLEREARLYELTWGKLEEAGYRQYEVSNFAREGHECLHNLNTWRMGEWVGLGPSAAEQLGGWRGANVSDLEKWASGVERGERLLAERVELREELLATDAVVFGLRMNEGVELPVLKGRFAGVDFGGVEKCFEKLAEEGLAELAGGRWRLTVRGRLVADAVGVVMMEAVEEK